MSLADEIIKGFKEGEEKVKKLLANYEDGVAEKKQLTEDLRTARVETVILNRKLELMQKENAKLKAQLSLVSGKEAGACQRTLTGNGKTCLGLLPEEVWDMIFEYLKEDPKDLKSCYEAGAEFRYLLEKEKQIFLFLDVVKLIPFASESDLMKCRLVCSGWKAAVDNFLQRDPEIFIPEPRWDKALGFCCEGMYGDQLRELSEEINPMPTRFLYYGGCTIACYAAPFFWNANSRRPQRRPGPILDFLNSNGQDVWFFMAEIQDISPTGYCSSPGFLYCELIEWLPLMPNLKGLYINQLLSNKGCSWWEEYARILQIDDIDDYDTDLEDDFESEDEDSEYEELTPHLNKQKLRILRAERQENPFPTIPTLKTLIFEDCPPQLVKSVLRSNPQIERLRVERGQDNFVKLNLGGMRMLKEVSLITYMRTYNELRFVNWNLQKLSLVAPNVKMGNIFPTLGQRFGSTLIELDLGLDGNTEEFCPRLNLPHLKVLDLKLRKSPSSIDFILRLLNLEYFTLAVKTVNTSSEAGSSNEKKYQPAEIVETIQFHQVDYDMKRSNIWKLFPKLKKVTYRRDGIEFGGNRLSKN